MSAASMVSSSVVSCSSSSPSSPPPSSFSPFLPSPSPASSPRLAFLSSSGITRRPCFLVRALVVDPSDSGVNDFTARMEKAWLISKQPRPVVCVSCKAEGCTECQWCRGTGFFILGDNMLCQVPSRNTKCLICLGQGTVHCKDCKGTGFIAKWLHNPSSNNKGI